MNTIIESAYISNRQCDFAISRGFYFPVKFRENKPSEFTVLRTNQWNQNDVLLAFVCMMVCHFSNWCPESGVVLNCIYSWSLPSSLLPHTNTHTHTQTHTHARSYTVCHTANSLFISKIITKVKKVHHKTRPGGYRNVFHAQLIWARIFNCSLKLKYRQVKKSLALK